MIGLINYGSGNINAIANIYNRLNIPHYFVNSISELDKANKLILPGVGDFDETMDLLTKMGMKDSLDKYVLDRKIPIMGVCVGMQILGGSSEEGKLGGFGWIKGEIKRIDETKIKEKPFLPHMGWNSIQIQRKHQILDGLDVEDGFYFLHSYYFDCDNEEDVLCTTEYGYQFPTAVNHGNVFGTQFHPEKSHTNGVQIFKNFANL